MIQKKLRAIAVALVLGTAAAATVGSLVVTAAEAAVRSAVGKPLQAALAAAQAGNYSQAMALVHQAEAVGGLSPEEQKDIAQMRDYISVKSGGSAGVFDAEGAKAKFANDWRDRRYHEVIEDGELLRKYGAMDGQSEEVIAQAYYLDGDYSGCIRAAGESSSQGMLELRMRCAFEAHDSAAMRSALEELVATTGKPEYWNQLLKLAQGAKGLSDHQTLDIYRIKYLTNSMVGADDYFTLAQLDLQFGLSSEAVDVVQKGMAAKVLIDGRAQRLLDLAKKNQGTDLAGLAATAKSANAAANGDALVKLGEDYCGMGRYKDAVEAIQAGIKKGVSDQDNAETRLGQALYGAGQKDAALKAFGKTTTTNGQQVAHLWSLYVKAH
jgi:TolA-binding protein